MGEAFKPDVPPVPAVVPGSAQSALRPAGWVLVDGAVAGEFRGALVRHRFDLTKQLSDAGPHRLSFIFDSVPPEQGQIGFTSRSRHFKPRYNYGWDWCPRLVPVGVWDKL